MARGIHGEADLKRIESAFPRIPRAIIIYAP